MILQSSFVVLVSFVVIQVKAQYFEVGDCPTNITVMPDFSIEKYLGLWYEYAKYPAIFEAGGKCITAEYSQRDDGNVGVKNSMVKISTGKTTDMVGYAEPVENAKLKVIFNVSPQFKASSNYWVLNSDYISYSVVYSCQSMNSIQRLTFVWILTRERSPADDVVEKAKDVLTQNGVSLTPLETAIQNDCD